MAKVNVNDKLTKLGIDDYIIKIFNNNDIVTIDDLWSLKRKDLKEVKKALPKANVKERFLLFKARDIVLESVVVK